MLTHLEIVKTKKNNWSFGSKFSLWFWQPNSDAPSSLIIIFCNVLLTRLLYCKFICNYIYDCELVFFVAIFLRYLAYNARYYSSRNSQYFIHAPAWINSYTGCNQFLNQLRSIPTSAAINSQTGRNQFLNQLRSIPKPAARSTAIGKYQDSEGYFRNIEGIFYNFNLADIIISFDKFILENNAPSQVPFKHPR